MTYVEPTEDLPPVAGSTIVYLGPVAPHWDIRATFGDSQIIDAFRTRVNARLLLLPKHDPQFRRNKERVNRDAERERIHLEWDLGDEEPRPEPAAEAAPAAEPAPVAEEAPVVEEAAAEASAAGDDAPEAASAELTEVEDGSVEDGSVEADVSGTADEAPAPGSDEEE